MKNKKKFGILTFHRGPNYGGFLQAWHMREAIRSLGYDATLINYQGLLHQKNELVNFQLRKLSPGHLKGVVLHSLKSRPFKLPVAELSDQPFTNDASNISWELYEKIVVGADVVWNFTDPVHGNDPVFFGAHPAQQKTSFVAYAPSCGDTSATDAFPDYVKDGLKRFSSVHVRDNTTADLVERVTGTRPELVVDPTWLQADPPSHCKKIPVGLKYALIYGQGATGQRGKAIGTFCKKHSLSVVSAAFPCEATTHRLYSIDPYEWVDLFRRAECVITSTFHGLLYAIKYNKPVLFMVRGPSRSKSKLAIDRCGISDRVIEENQPFTDEILDHCLTRSDGCEIPQEWKKLSWNLLKKSLSDI